MQHHVDACISSEHCLIFYAICIESNEFILFGYREERFDMNELQEKWESLALKDNIVNGRPMFFI